MASYGDGGTTYGSLFGGGVALYGAFGGVTATTTTRHRILERTLMSLNEVSSLTLIEQCSDILRERSAGRYIEQSEVTS